MSLITRIAILVANGDRKRKFNPCRGWKSCPNFYVSITHFQCAKTREFYKKQHEKQKKISVYVVPTLFWMLKICVWIVFTFGWVFWLLLLLSWFSSIFGSSERIKRIINNSSWTNRESIFGLVWHFVDRFVSFWLCHSFFHFSLNDFTE